MGSRSASSLLFLPPLFLGVGCSLLFPQHGQKQPSPIIRPALERLAKKVLVVDFLNQTAWGGPELGRHARGFLLGKLSGNPAFVPIDGDSVEGKELFYAPGPRYNREAILSRCRQEGWAGVVTGTIEGLELKATQDPTGLIRARTVTLSAKVHVDLEDATTESSFFSRDFSAVAQEVTHHLLGVGGPAQVDPDDALVVVDRALGLAAPLLPAFGRRLQWEGRVVRSDNGRVLVESADMEAIDRGQILQVFSQTTQVNDPATGKPWGRTPGKFKGLIEVRDFIGTEGALARAKLGGGFASKDALRLFIPERERK